MKAKETRYQRQLKGQSSTNGRGQAQVVRSQGRRESLEKSQLRSEGDEIDSKFGFDRFREGSPRLGWLLNYLPITLPDESGIEKTGLDLYFLDRQGGNFKAAIFHQPYFFVDVDDPRKIMEVIQHIQKRFDNCFVEAIDKEDLDMVNHLTGKKHKFLKLSFNTVAELIETKQKLWPIIQQNLKRQSHKDYFTEEDAEAGGGGGGGGGRSTGAGVDTLECLVDMREYDIPYTMRVAVDLDLRVGAWYVVAPTSGSECCTVVWQREMLELCEPRVLAFDIECEKSPLKFPDSSRDRIYMISYMICGQGYLLINREVVTEDVDNFEYTPLSKYPGPFIVMNEVSEQAVLCRFIQHIQELKPHVIVTYNGDGFDWPFLENRCEQVASISLYRELGIKSSENVGAGGITAPEREYTGRCIVHLDAFCWVKRDSYLPQGNQGLKAVTKYKLGYNPIEVDPEDMLRLAQEKPTHMASYSVSDAVATYYLYTSYVHNFIFSLSTIIPMGPEDVLRKGSGTLCEALLIVEAYKGNIICPNKQVDALESFHNGHLLQSETYIGGHVECIEAGVFRADIPTEFNVVPSALQQLIDNIDRDLTFALETEHDIQRSDIANYDDVRQAIVERLEMLRDNPHRKEAPVIYHLDVGAMYPNIILTNRLQPSAMVSLHDCAACDFNKAENNCKRPMTWTWRGEYSPASMAEYQSTRRQLAYEKDKNFVELSEKAQAAMVKERLKIYSNRVYKKSKVTEVKDRVNTVCMRENPFYVNTVRAFRDRRYDYKLLTKTWKGKKVEAEKKGDVVGRKSAEDKEILMDSLQLAHKCILNSFYGYVMRKGARWRSMEMAGIVTKTGAELIKQARELVEQVGRPLELDTDGIWCILPSSFPQDFKFKTKAGGKVSLGYPCAMLNADVHDRYTNHQYQDLAEGAGTGVKKKYNTHSECSIYFELDGPYKAMVLPASPEEGKLLKKKYVVFNFDSTIAELKGFEIKRRGELELVKAFQSQVFDQFLSGSSLADCYRAVGDVANQWMDVLDSCGCSLDDDELLQLISEKKTISKTIDDYEGRKATSLTTAARLADFLGAEMVKDKGLNCNLIISRLPAGTPVTERAIPVAIFSAEPAVKRHYLRKWLKDPAFDCSDFRDVVDWEYYKERLGKTIQKIITIPAGMQGITNPVPRVDHPVWLQRAMNDSVGLKQKKLTSMFVSVKKLHSDGSLKVPMPKLVSTKVDNDREIHADELAVAGTSLILSPAGKKKRVQFEPTPDSKLRSIDRKRNLFGSVHEDVDSGIGSSLADEFSDGVVKAPIQDIEDIGGRSIVGTGGRPIAHFRSSRSNAPPDSPPRQDITPPAQILTPTSVTLLCSELETALDFTEWLGSRKETWKAKRMAKKMARVASSGKGKASAAFPWSQNEDENAKKKPVGVADFVRNASLAATQGYWQIIELQETDTPGEFTVWAMTGKTQLQRLKLTVPRVMYVSCNGKSAEAIVTQELGGTKAKKDLPHGRQSHSLYEVRVSERKYQRNEKTNFLSEIAQIEGVYETQTPLWYRTVLRTGCIARLARLPDSKGPTGFHLHDLEFVSVAAHPYLEPVAAVYRKIFLYMSLDRTRNSGFGCVGLFIVEGTNAETTTIDGVELLSAKAHVWLANGGSAFDSKPPLQRIYKNFQRNDAANVKFSTKFTPSQLDSFRACNEALNSYLRGRHGPTVVIAQGAADARQLRKQIPNLQEMPLTIVPANSQDDLFPALGWQTFIAERMVQRFLIFPRWLQDRLACARHSHIPVCNLGQDSLTTMIDVSYGRQLQHNRHLLWSSEGLHPDLGGAEDDEHTIWSDPLKEPSLNYPGAYRSICVELDVYGLAVCAIMSSGLLDAEGITAVSVHAHETVLEDSGIGQDAKELSAFASTSAMSTDASCARAFNLLKAVVAKWVEDVKQRGDEISDSILTALYRYLCGFGDSLLRDPLLHRIVYGLMCKLFQRLVGQLRRLNVRIVHASFSRVIVHTGKRDLPSAVEYVEYIVSTLATNDLFTYLEINSKNYWEQILWMGPENWGGIAIHTDSPHADQIVEESDELDDSQAMDEVSADDHTALPEQTSSKFFSSFKKKKPAKKEEFGKSKEFDFLDNLLTDANTSKKKSGSLSSSGLSQTNDEDFIEDDDDELDAIENGDEDWAHNGDVYPEEEVHDEEEEVLAGKRGGRGEEDDGNASIHATSSVSSGLPAMGSGEDLVQSNWNLASFLPPAAANYFSYLIGEFMLQYRKRRAHLVNQRDRILSAEISVGEKEIPMDDESIDAAVVASMQSLLRKRLTIDMLKLVDELAQIFSHGYDRRQREIDSSAPSDSFPLLAGSHLSLNSPALEFVKAVTHVMSLDADLAEDVSCLKRLVLTQLRVKEFSAESQFQDPCLSFVLRDVICGYCSTCRDIDLLRDPVLASPVLELEDRWRCSHCANALNTVQVENRLLDDLGKYYTNYLLQDFRCPVTHQVATRHCAEASDLCVPLAMDISQPELMKYMFTLSRVAAFHKFVWLQQTVSNLGGTLE